MWEFSNFLQHFVAVIPHIVTIHIPVILEFFQQLLNLASLLFQLILQDLLSFPQLHCIFEIFLVEIILNEQAFLQLFPHFFKFTFHIFILRLLDFQNLHRFQIHHLQLSDLILSQHCIESNSAVEFEDISRDILFEFKTANLGNIIPISKRTWHRLRRSC